MVASFGVMFARAGVPTSEVASGFLIPNLPQQDIATVSELAGCRSKRAAFKNVLTARLATDSKAKGLQNGCSLVWLPHHAPQHLPSLGPGACDSVQSLSCLRL
eukprot:1158330-Pelagomonas_calceolata.AAC.7